MLSSCRFLGLLLAQFLTSFPTKAPPCLSCAPSLTYIHHMVSLLYFATEAHRHGRFSLRSALSWTKKCYCTPPHHCKADTFASTYLVCTNRTKWQKDMTVLWVLRHFEQSPRLKKKKLHDLCLRVFSSQHPAFKRSQWFTGFKTELNVLFCRADTPLVVEELHIHTCNAKIVVPVWDLRCNRTAKDVPVTRYTYSRTCLWQHRLARHLACSVQHSVVPINSSLLTVTLYSSLITTLVYNDIKYSFPFMTLWPGSNVFCKGVTVFLNVLRFYGKRVNVISFTSVRKARPSLHRFSRVIEKLVVDISRAEF
jgi:hypothetical protein